MLQRTLLLALAFVVALPAAAQQAPTPAAVPGERPRNVIMMIPDGFGPASLTMARMAKGAPLALDEFLTGNVGTEATDSHVTDSAAGATAYASGIKTYNGAIGVDTLQRPVGTVLEGAQSRGMRTGLVTTTRLTHATPAAFAAHVPARAMEEEIAAQMTARSVDLLLGGGLRFFLPRPDGRRTDDRDLLAGAREAGYHVIHTAEELAAARALPILGIFSDDHLAYEVDRHRTDQPSLAEMTRRALELLGGHDSGFFLMVEGGRIDHAGHGNDAAGHLHDILAYDEAVRIALDFAAADGRTLVVSAADHETGGLSIGRDGHYAYYPHVLLQTTASGEWMQGEAQRRAGDGAMDVPMLEAIILEVTALEELTDADRADLAAALEAASQWEPGQSMGRLIGRHALVGWTTGGHTGVDVTLHAFGPGSERLRGHLPNDEVGRIVADLLGVDLAAETARLREAMPEAVGAARD
jgi:alkaline phosphatase